MLDTSSRTIICATRLSHKLSVTLEPKFQAPAPPSKIAWAPAPQPWLKKSNGCSPTLTPKRVLGRRFGPNVRPVPDKKHLVF